MDRDVETHPFGFVNASLEAAAWRELQTLLGLLLIAAAILCALAARGAGRPFFFRSFSPLVSYLPVSGLVTLERDCGGTLALSPERVPLSRPSRGDRFLGRDALATARADLPNDLDGLPGGPHFRPHSSIGKTSALF